MSMEVKMLFSRDEFAQEFLSWAEEIVASGRDFPWFRSSETMMMMTSVDKEKGTVEFTGLSAGEEDEEDE